MRDTLVLFTSVTHHPTLVDRLQSFPRLTAGPQFERYACGDGTFEADFSQDVLEECDEGELAWIAERIGTFRATLIAYEDMACARTLLERTIPDLNGVLDTNYESLVSFPDAMRWLTLHPYRHFREGPPPDLLTDDG
ncbi:hypothetical protein [Streptomyces buecherae]|uniref:hypothetical protein n=1 Tax=Streptomyces buecherae TaxID=2763006 RepID=UPI00364DF191